VGDQVPEEDIYIVTDSHSHAWVEVFFPGHGWIAFEPTPGAAIPVAAVPAPEEETSFSGDFSGDPFALGCEDDEDECLDDDGPLTTGTGVGEEQLTLAQQLARSLPWLLPLLGMGVLVGGFGWFFWRRYLVPSENPEVAFRHLAFLGALNSVGPAPYQTPYQYLDRLAQAFPGQREGLSEIVDTYVRSHYGNKELSNNERSGLVRAWQGLRFPLLIHVVRRRSGEHD
jgi:hypothetical protein